MYLLSSTFITSQSWAILYSALYTYCPYIWAHTEDEFGIASLVSSPRAHHTALRHRHLQKQQIQIFHVCQVILHLHLQVRNWSLHHQIILRNLLVWVLETQCLMLSFVLLLQLEGGLFLLVCLLAACSCFLADLLFATWNCFKLEASYWPLFNFRSWFRIKPYSLC